MRAGSVFLVAVVAACGSGASGGAGSSAQRGDAAPGYPGAGDVDAAVDAKLDGDIDGGPPQAGQQDAAPPVVGTAYYVDSAATAPFDGSLAHPWKTIAQMTASSSKFEGGDVVHFSGSFAGQIIEDSGSGQPGAHLVFQGDGGRVLIGGISLVNTRYVEFVNFEATGSSSELVVVPGTTGTVSSVWFRNLHLHDAARGVDIGANSDRTHNQCAHVSGKDITFEDTTIERMQYDGIVLDDCAGDRFSFIGGKIVDTGNTDPGYGTHGMYLSGGHGHVIDGATFGQNRHGWSISIRRGHTTVRNCEFDGCAAAGMINNNNEDEGPNPSVTPPASDDPPHGLTYVIYRNLFLGTPGGACVAIYQSSPNDAGVADPDNTWAVFNNTFVDTALDFGDGSGSPQGYGIHLHNNAFVGGSVRMVQAASGRAHELSNNGYFLDVALSLGGVSQGAGNVMDAAASPLDATSHAVTYAGCVDAGTETIVPPSALVMVPQALPPLAPLGYLGAAPDIGHSER